MTKPRLARMPPSFTRPESRAAVPRNQEKIRAKVPRAVLRVKVAAVMWSGSMAKCGGWGARRKWSPGFNLEVRKDWAGWYGIEAM